MPDYFFVIDEMGYELTAMQGIKKGNIIITGSPKHEHYKYMVDEWVAIDPFDHHSANFVFFGQPYKIPGMLSNFEIFCESLRYSRLPVKLHFKPHPLDKNNIRAFEGILRRHVDDYNIVPGDIKTVTLLMHADAVISCFSTVGLDHNYLQLYSHKRMGHLIYLNIGEEIQGYMEKVIGVKRVPGAAVGMGTTIDRREDLIEWIIGYADGIIRNDEYKRYVDCRLASIASPSDKIFQFINSLHVNSGAVL